MAMDSDSYWAKQKAQSDTTCTTTVSSSTASLTPVKTPTGLHYCFPSAEPKRKGWESSFGLVFRWIRHFFKTRDSGTGSKSRR